MAGLLGRALCALAGVVVFIALGHGLVFAQGSTGAITGSVKDVSGAVLPGAAVTLKHTETGLMRSAQADVAGGFSVLSLPVGQYEITAEKMGFRKEVRNGINLAVGQEAVVDLILQVGSIDQQVTVTGEAPLVNTTVSSTSGLITENQLKDLPLNGRSFDQLLTLNPGTSNSSSNTFNGNAWATYSVAGKRPETNRFIVNGVDYIGGNSTGLYITPSGASGMLLGVDAVREYNVVTDTYGAEYGKRAGGQISIVTSSGTNQLHGEAFEFLRNSAFDARNSFDSTIGTPPFKRNQFGGALGGPLKKDKLFLFGNYEAFRQRLAVSDTAVVPGAMARLGRYPNGSPIPNVKMLAYANAFWPAPDGPDLPDGTALSHTNPGSSTNEDFGLARFDYIVSNKDTFSANYTIDSGNKLYPRPNAFYAQNTEIDSQTAGLQETHVFSPSVVNLVTLGYARAFSTNVSGPVVPVDPSLVFMPGGNPGSIIIGGGIFTVQQSSVVPADSANPTAGARNYYTEADDLHWIRGKHSFSAGGWIQRVENNVAGGPQGSAANVAYKSVTDFLQDKASQALVVRNPVMVGYRSLEAAWYVQDEIKLRPNLTMRVGLRDEMTNGWNEVAGRCANYQYDPGFVIQTNPTIGNSCLAANNAKALWQPRVGLAWDPTGTGTWAVRTGFGIHNDLLDNLTGRAYPNPPYQAREQLIVTNGFLPLLPLQKNVPLPPTCNPQLVAAKQLCSIYQPGGFDPYVHTPTVQMWNFTVDRQLAKDLMLSVGYVGSQSYHTSFSVDNNMAPPQVCQNAKGCLSGGVLKQTAMVPQGTLYMPSTPPITVGGPIGSLIQRPNPYVSNNTAWWNQGTSGYHALNVSLLKRMSHGLTFKTNYSYAKVMDLNSSFFQVSGGENEPADVFSPYNLALNRGPAAFSLHHQLSTNFSYALPFGNGHRFGSGAGGLMNRFIGGWQWNGIITAQGGFPLAPQIGFNNSGTGDNNVTDVPSWNPNFKGPVILGQRDQWFNPDAFILPAVGTFGNVSRGSLRGPGLVDVDTSFFKQIKVSERLNMQLRAEAFNILNKANYGYPNAVLYSGAPGTSTQTACPPKGSTYSCVSTAGATTFTSTSSRQLQLALKLMF
ncbi:MAG TPA: carboxypeptidase regulatory-like domain-containing protein [Bryobacteraceae bacterium]|nr:carboxypeptidase regulatory-like domain-containing protein [Bryobacteraceae bacterium]